MSTEKQTRLRHGMGSSQTGIECADLLPLFFARTSPGPRFRECFYGTDTGIIDRNGLKEGFVHSCGIAEDISHADADLTMRPVGNPFYCVNARARKVCQVDRQSDRMNFNFGETAMNLLTTQEFRFLQAALRGGPFDFHSCGCMRRELLLSEVEAAVDADVADDFDIDLDELSVKLNLMSGEDTAKLIENVNKCLFADTVIFAEFDDESTSEDLTPHNN